MEFENLIMKVVMKYMDDNKIKNFSYEHAWELAKRIATVAKKKSKKDMHTIQREENLVGFNMGNLL